MVEVIEKNSKTEVVKGLSKNVVSSSTEAYRIRILLGTLFVLVVGDGFVSNFIVAQGLGRELNPFLQTLVGKEDFSLILLKVVGALSCSFILWRIYRKRPRISIIATVLTVVVYTGIAYWNLIVLWIAQAKAFFLTM